MNTETANTKEFSKENLSFLYEISHAINTAENNSSIFDELLKLITKKTNAQSAIVRILSDDGWMSLHASYGIDKDHLTSLNKTPIDASLFHHETHATKQIRRTNTSALIKTDNTDMILIPVRHQDHTLGALNIFCKNR